MFPSLLLPWLLAIPAFAAPQAASLTGGPVATPPPAGPAPPATSSTASKVSTGPSAGPSDKCGPTVPDPTVPESCDSFVQEVDAPAAYGVHCDNDGSGMALNATSCEQIILIMCEKQWQHPGEWAWATYGNCSLGSFLPPVNYTGGAPWPNQANCEVLIYGAMLESCADGTSNRAAVNLKVLPNDTPAGKGEAVNVGYPSYIINPTQPRFLSDKTCTQGNPEYPVPCAFVEGPNAVQLPAAGLISQAAVQEAAAEESFRAAYVSQTAAAAAVVSTNRPVADDAAGNASLEGSAG